MVVEPGATCPCLGPLNTVPDTILLALVGKALRWPCHTLCHMLMSRCLEPPALFPPQCVQSTAAYYPTILQTNRCHLLFCSPRARSSRHHSPGGSVHEWHAICVPQQTREPEARAEFLMLGKGTFAHESLWVLSNPMGLGVPSLTSIPPNLQKCLETAALTPPTPNSQPWIQDCSLAEDSSCL